MSTYQCFIPFLEENLLLIGVLLAVLQVRYLKVIEKSGYQVRMCA